MILNIFSDRNYYKSRFFASRRAQQQYNIIYIVSVFIELCTRGECSKMPRVSKMPTPLKTYCKLQVCILVVYLHVATYREPSCAVMFRNSRYFRDYSDFLDFDHIGLTMHCEFVQFSLQPYAPLICAFRRQLWVHFKLFLQFIQIENVDRVK